MHQQEHTERPLMLCWRLIIYPFIDDRWQNSCQEGHQHRISLLESSLLICGYLLPSEACMSQFQRFKGLPNLNPKSAAHNPGRNPVNQKHEHVVENICMPCSSSVVRRAVLAEHDQEVCPWEARC